MATKPLKKKPNAKAIAEPVRILLVELLREKLKTKEAKNRVAKALGKSASTLGSLLYQGKGGFDLMVAALIVANDLDRDFLLTLRSRFEKEAEARLPTSDLDKRWKALDESIDEIEKERWLSVIEFYISRGKQRR